MRKLTVNVDMDGVLYDMVNQFIHMAWMDGHIKGHVPTSHTIGSWAMWDHLKLPKDFFWQLFHQYTGQGLFRWGKPITDGVGAVRNLRDAGHRVRIVTSKTLRKQESTLTARMDVLGWLNEYGLGDLEVVFTGGYAKQGYPADVVVDDKPTLEWVQDGALNLLFAQPWNRGIDWTSVRSPRIRRADGWTDVFASIMDEAEREAA